jgi:hypothetical protein
VFCHLVFCFLSGETSPFERSGRKATPLSLGWQAGFRTNFNVLARVNPPHRNFLLGLVYFNVWVYIELA